MLHFPSVYINTYKWFRNTYKITFSEQQSLPLKNINENSNVLSKVRWSYINHNTSVAWFSYKKGLLKCNLVWSIVVNIVMAYCPRFKMLTNGISNFFYHFQWQPSSQFLKSLSAVAAAAFDTKRHIPKLLNFCYAFHYLSPFHFPAPTLQCVVP